MNLQEFTNQVTRLKNVFGEKSYPNERVEQIWKWAKELSSNKFSSVVDSAIEECDRAPLLAKLKEIAKIAYTAKEKIQCFYCDGSGWYVPKNSPALPTAYACHCEAGQEIPSYVARFNGPKDRAVPTAAEMNWRNQPAVQAMAASVFKTKSID